MSVTKSGNYEERVYYYYNVCDMKAIIAGEYVNYEKLLERLGTDDSINPRQRITIKEGLEKLKRDIEAMNFVSKLS